MMSAIVVLSACLLLAAQGSASQIGFGDCPKKGNIIVSNFAAQRYMGLWYEIEAYSQIWELGGKCSTAQYSLKDGSTVAVKNSMRTIFGTEVTQEGTAVVTSKNGDAELLVSFNVPVFGDRQANYWVLDTDYDNYAVVYSCSNLGPLKIEAAWILGRATSLSDDSQTKVEASIALSKLDRKAFRPTKQDC